MQALAVAKAEEAAAYWNERYDNYFLQMEVPNWLANRTTQLKGLPKSPPVLVGRAEKQTFGWQPLWSSVGDRYTREDILILLDTRYQEVNNTGNSLWDTVGSEVRAACGLDNPDTPGKFGKAVGSFLPGCYHLAPDDLPVPENGTERTVDGVTYVLTGGFIKYWKPVA